VHLLLQANPDRTLSHHLFSHLRGARALLLAVAIAGSLLGFLLASQGAGAYGVNYCANWYASGTGCEGPNHSLDANIAWDDTGSNAWVCDTATNSSGGNVGGWECGYGMSETCYGGNQLLHGWILNDSTYWLYMNGTEYYSQGCP
jgi:hypothetical protein